MRQHLLRDAALFSILALTAHSVTTRAADAPAERTNVGTLSIGASAQVSTESQWLNAGPVRLKFEDGQLRYLRVGEKEIVRRIYFAVRDAKWDTATPKYSQMEIEKAEDHFTVHLAAECKRGTVDYGWKGTIVGTADGKITFQTEGTANADFDSNRIGLCVLFGTPSLATQEFESDGITGKSVFPALISPKLVAEKFHSLRYTTADGLHVSCALEGATFDMEDQRNWGDSSWKAYAPLPYAYKHIDKGDSKSETVTLTVGGTLPGKAAPQDPVRMKIGQLIAGAQIPNLPAAQESTEKIADFTAFSFARDKFAGQKLINWSYIPTTHLPDNDTIMENLPAIADQARTIKSVNSDCVLHAGPLHIPDKMNEPIVAAWAAGAVKYLALGGVEEAVFHVGQDAPSAVLNSIRPYAGQKVLAVETEPQDSHHFITFAAENQQGRGLFLVNRTAHAWHAEVQGLSSANVQVLHVQAGSVDQAAIVEGGVVKLEIAPYGVCRVTIPK